MKKPLLNFKQHGKDHLGYNFFYIYNHENEFLGTINKSRVGRFMHWIFCPESKTYYTNGCMREIIDFISSLYSKEKNDQEGLEI